MLRGLPAGLVAGGMIALAVFVVEIPLWPVLAVFLSTLLTWRQPVAWVALIGFAWVSLSLHWQLQDRLDPGLNGQQLVVQGQIEGLPEVYESYTRFRFLPDHEAGTGFNPTSGLQNPELPSRLLVYWYRDPPAILPGESWQFNLLVRPPWGKVNFTGPDRERWLFSERIGALATVQSGEKILTIRSVLPDWNTWRHAVLTKIEQSIPDVNLRGVISALAVADRSGMPEEQRDTLAATGTAHLLAISGLHIGLAALFGFWLSRIALSPLPPRWTAGRAYLLTLLLGLFAASLYAAMAGFGTSTVRALVMLAVGLLVVGTRRAISPLQALLIAMTVILMLDPAAPLGAGFWLSFTAVTVLIFLFSGTGSTQSRWWLKLGRAQAGIMLVMLPLTAFWFGSASPAGLVANVVAIPWVSMVTVPLVLLALLTMPLSDPLSAFLFLAAAHTAGCLLDLLSVMSRWPVASFNLVQPAIWLVLLASLGALLLMFPRGLPGRWLGLALVLPLFAQARSPDPGAIRVDILDVGQGTAVLLSSESHLLLYDSGPGDGERFNLVNQVIEPAIRHSGHDAPDRIIISHADLDHAGGLTALQLRYPFSRISAKLPEARPGLDSCDNGLKWNWDGIGFEVLHPGPFLPYLGNDSSCVLSVRTAHLSILLPGDISTAVEQRLLQSGLLPHDVLLAPHHGSNSSSSIAFLQRLEPKAAVATAGAGNRFDFPRPEVMQRFRNLDIVFWSTNACGAVRFDFSGDGSMTVSSARQTRRAPWRWPAEAGCP